MQIPPFNTRAKVWLYPGHAAWHFLTIPKTVSLRINSQFGALSHGWGSLPVRVTIGMTHWKTSVFWDNKAGAYLLPLKSDVRKKERITAGDIVRFSVEIQL